MATLEEQAQDKALRVLLDQNKVLLSEISLLILQKAMLLSEVQKLRVENERLNKRKWYHIFFRQ